MSYWSVQWLSVEGPLSYRTGIFGWFTVGGWVGEGGRRGVDGWLSESTSG